MAVAPADLASLATSLAASPAVALSPKVASEALDSLATLVAPLDLGLEAQLAPEAPGGAALQRHFDSSAASVLGAALRLGVRLCELCERADLPGNPAAPSCELLAAAARALTSLRGADAAAVAERWAPWRTAASWFLWRTIDPEPVLY